MSISHFFNDELGAPLTNRMWSWGARRTSDGAIIVRGWNDENAELRTVNGRRYLRLTNHAAYAGNTRSLGYRERLRHVAEIEQGTPGFAIICQAEANTPTRRRIRSYDRTLQSISRIVTIEGDQWAELAD